MAVGGVSLCTIKDLYTWQKALLNHTLLSHELTKQMLMIQTPITQTGGYGYGIIYDTFMIDGNTHEMIYHPGNGPGVFAQSSIIDYKIHLIMLSNINDKDRFRRTYDEIFEAITKKIYYKFQFLKSMKTVLVNDEIL